MWEFIWKFIRYKKNPIYINLYILKYIGNVKLFKDQQNIIE